VDDALIVENKTAIKETVSQLRTKVSLKEVEHLTEYVGCTVIRDHRFQKLLMCQPDLIDKLEYTFKSKISKLQHFKTPAALGEITMKAISENKKVDVATQKMF
jgi:hypothetical protein